ncbi:MAG: Ig-like domain-containing protein, partial [Desulfobacteraceae bacterium]
MKMYQNRTYRFILIFLISISTMACASYPSGPRSPQPEDDQYSLEEDGYLDVPVEEGILINDKPREGTLNILMTLGEVTTDNGGVINLADDGSFTYKPATDFNGTDHVTYTIKNEKGKSSQGNITFSVSSLPDSPKPVDDHREITEGQPITIDVLANDVEPDGEAMKLVELGEPISGTAEMTADGQVVYTPDPNHSGDVEFYYIVSDVNGLEAAGWVFVSIINVDNGIDAQPDTMTTVEDNPATIALSLLLANDTDLENGAALTVMELGTPQNGTVVLNGDESLTYTPEPDFFGTDTFTYMVQSQSGSTASATVTVTVTPVADAPTISDISDQTALEDTPITGIAFTVNDAETAVEELIVSGTSSNLTLVPNGNIEIGGSGANRTVSITPAPNQFGTTRITLTVEDAQEGTNSTSFLLTVTAVNDPPVISDIADQTIAEDGTLGPVAFTVSDPDRAAAQLEVTGTSSNQTLVPNANIIFGGTGSDRTVTITPAANQSGTAIITLTVIDDAGPNAQDTFTLTVNAVDDAPTISGINATHTTNEDTPITLPFTIADIDTAISALNITATSGNVGLVPNTNIRINGTGANRNLVITPLANAFGQARITLSVTGGETVGTFAFTLIVTGVNDAPTITAIADRAINWNPLSGGAPTPFSVNFTVGDLETPVGQLALSYTITPAYGTIAFRGTGAIRTATVTPAVRSGSFNISIVVTDAGGATGTSNFVMTVNVVLTSTTSTTSSTATLSSTSDSVLLSDESELSDESDGESTIDEYETTEDVALSIPASAGLLANITNSTETSFEVISTEIISSYHGGEVQIDTDGGFYYIPPANFEGQDGFEYQYSPAETDGISYSGDVTITITGVNDPPLAETDIYSAIPGQMLTILPEQGVLANDRDVEDESLQVINQSNSYLALDSDGGFTYIPSGNFTGQDTFTYQVSDGNSISTSSIIFVVDGNQVPLVNTDSYVIEGVDYFEVSAAQGLLSNDSDPDGIGLTIISTGVYDTLFGGQVNIQSN